MVMIQKINLFAVHDLKAEFCGDSWNCNVIILCEHNANTSRAFIMEDPIVSAETKKIALNRYLRKIRYDRI